MASLNLQQADQLVILNVNATNVLEDVQDDKYNSRPKFLTSKAKKKPKTAELIVQSQSNAVTLSNQQPSYTIVSVTGKQINVVTSEISATLEDTTQPGECLYCRTWSDNLTLGICYDITIDVETGKQIYYLKNRRICSPPCLISQLGYMHIPARERPTIEGYTLALLRSVCGDDYVPEAADDFMLLEKSGGSLTYDKWSDPLVSYDPSQMLTTRVVPTKAEYIVHRKL
ncbi:Hypothetical protein POVR2_LOCUS409 [uncultured virus]|nr:Hypothetical protein POVR2_LOCUS409 [uncultured virus]